MIKPSDLEGRARIREKVETYPDNPKPVQGGVSEGSEGTRTLKKIPAGRGPSSSLTLTFSNGQKVTRRKKVARTVCVSQKRQKYSNRKKRAAGAYVALSLWIIGDRERRKAEIRQIQQRREQVANVKGDDDASGGAP